MCFVVTLLAPLGSEVFTLCCVCAFIISISGWIPKSNQAVIASGQVGDNPDNGDGTEQGEESCRGCAGAQTFGVTRWRAQRNEWRKLRPGVGRVAREVDLDQYFDALYTELSKRNMTLPEPFPVSQAIELLSEVWEDEGLWDK